jgi:hypothetical protein
MRGGGSRFNRGMRICKTMSSVYKLQECEFQFLGNRISYRNIILLNIIQNIVRNIIISKIIQNLVQEHNNLEHYAEVLQYSAFDLISFEYKFTCDHIHFHNSHYIFVLSDAFPAHKSGRHQNWWWWFRKYWRSWRTCAGVGCARLPAGTVPTTHGRGCWERKANLFIWWHKWVTWTKIFSPDI